MSVAVLQKLLAAVNDPPARLEDYNYCRKILKLRSNQCAATASLMLMRVGALDRVRTWTADLEAALAVKGWRRRRDDPLPGAVCFSEDRNNNGAADHVYIFIRWMDQPKGVAEVYDNYSANTGLRNIRKAVDFGGQRLSRTPMDFYMVPPDAPQQFSADDALALHTAFGVLYSAIERVPSGHQLLNLLRAEFRKAGVN